MKSTEKVFSQQFYCNTHKSLPLKCPLSLLEHPFFNISQNIVVNYSEDFIKAAYIYPVKPTYRYGDWFININPGSSGAPKLADKEIIIFLVSHLIDAIEQKNPVSQTIRFIRSDLLKMMQRRKSGASYNALVDALKRLDKTKFETNIAISKNSTIESFSFIELTGSGVEEDRIEVKLCDWLYRQIIPSGVITLDTEYPVIRKPIERRVYELIRKHCGNKRTWKIGIGKLHTKSGSTALLKEFTRVIRRIIDTDSLVQYRLSLENNRAANGDYWVHVEKKNQS